MMKLYAQIFTVLFLLSAVAQAAVAKDDPLDSVSYQSFPQMVANSEVQNVEIYDFSSQDVDAVLTLQDGSRIGVKKPHGMDDDAVLHQYLKDNGVQYTIYDYEFPGKGKHNGLFGTRSPLFMVMPMVLMFGVPVVLVLVILRQSKTIAKQAETIRIYAQKDVSSSDA